MSERMTTRERRERRAEQREEWALSRKRKAAAANAASHDATAGIPFGQPILVGHHSERRHRNAIERAQREASAMVEHGKMADRHEAAAKNIAAANDRAIYDDDVDVLDRLREKIAGLEAERERIKAYNASCRKAAKTGGVGDTSLLSAEERADLMSTAKAAPYMLGAGGQMPRYKLTNLGGTIRNAKQRLERLERNGGKPADRTITARFDSSCEQCGAALTKGDTIRFNRADGARCAPECEEE